MRRSLILDGARVLAVVYLVWVWQFLVVSGSHVDVEAYWRAASGDPYSLSHAGDAGAFLYAPVIAQIIAPLGGWPLIVFVGGLLALSLASAIYLIGLIPTALVLLLPLPFVWQDLGSGNIHVLIGAATVLGFRYPAVWSFVLLTKVTPGIGLLWFVARNEWRALGVVLLTTVAAAGLSFMVDAGLWREWVDVLRANASSSPAGLSVPVPLLVRLPLAATLVWWGASRDQRWTVPAAAFMALPVIWLYDGFAVLLGVIGLLLRRGGEARKQHPSPDVSVSMSAPC